MPAILRSIPAALALLVLGAHFVRAAQLGLGATCVVAAGLAFLRRSGVVAIVRIALVAASSLWVLTAWRIAQARIASGEPYARMALILGGVAVFTALSAWILPPAPAPSPRT